MSLSKPSSDEKEKFESDSSEDVETEQESVEWMKKQLEKEVVFAKSVTVKFQE